MAFAIHRIVVKSFNRSSLVKQQHERHLSRSPQHPSSTPVEMDLRQRVQESLSGTHTIERELGGGGMSRVFVASETRLGRQVVVKVLAPELAAAMSTERFEREIQLSASLQQANIVPVISAGDLDGLPYYTMPFVEGESLRARLAKGPLAIDAAIDVLRDVAKALAYAHERGVVHRDIKPDNILLSGRSAVVADFGIAKAIAAAQEKPAGATLTQLGTALGTPAYMAPEQAAGDPSTDHHADIYAYGCMAYEMFAGHPPFHGLAPHKLMAAHMGETPRPIEELRPDVPAALARLITRCLAKDPEKRPANADELLQELAVTTSGPSSAMPFHGRGLLLRAMAVYAAVFIGVAIVARLLITTQGLPEWIFSGALVVMALGFPVILFTGYAQYVARRVAQATPTLTPQGSVVRASANGTLAQLAVKASPHMSWTRTARGGVAALTAFALLVAGYLLLRVLGIGPSGSLLAAGKLNAQDKVIVASFDAASKDSALGDVVAVAVRTNLAQSRALQLVPTSGIVAALARMQKPASSRVDLALAREIAAREGIKAVVAGNIASAGNGFIITARLVSAATGDEMAVYQESAGSAADIIPAVDRLTKQLRGKIGESLKAVAAAPPLAQVTTSSIDALRSYAAALRANDVEGDFQKAIPLFEDAIAKDSGFAAAYLQLSTTLSNAGIQRQRQDTLLTAAYRLRARLPNLERNDVEGGYFWFKRDRPKAIAAYERALAIDSMDPEALNSLAVISGQTRANARAVQLMRRSIAVEPESGILYSNLAFTLLELGKFDEADSVYRIMGERKIEYPTFRQQATLLYARGELDSAEARARANAKTGSPQRSANLMGFVRAIAEVRGRLRESDSIAVDVRDRNKALGASVNPYTIPFRMALDDAFLRGQNARAIARIDSAIRTQPLTAVSPAGAILEAATNYAIAGAPERGRPLLQLFDEAAKDSVNRQSFPGQRAWAEGNVLMAERRPDEAVRVFRRMDTDADGLPINCPFCMPLALGRAYDQMNQADSSIANLERYLATPSNGRLNADTWMLAPAHKRLGELYEAKGEMKKASEHYGTFVELWKRADPELQPKVTEVKARLERIRRALPR
jgi:tRNA A-37 threonylcarbamoyl transferase component Bud32/tetratricopeptide (TPR) repeat protein